MDTGSAQNKGKKLPKPNNIVTIPTNHIEFFKWWCIMLRPFINLTIKEIDVVASFLHQRYELSKSITDPTILDTMVMSNDTKLRVIEECKITQQHFYVIMSNFRKNKVIVGNVLNPKLIPNIREDDNGVFQLLILFKNNNAA